MVLFASETLTLTKKAREKLDMWKSKILRGIYGGRKENEVQKRRTNQGMYTLYGGYKGPEN